MSCQKVCWQQRCWALKGRGALAIDVGCGQWNMMDFCTDWIRDKTASFLHQPSSSLRTSHDVKIPYFVEISSECHQILTVSLAQGFTFGLVKSLSPQFERGLYITHYPSCSLHIRLACQSESVLSLGRLWIDRGLLEAVHLHRFGHKSNPWLLKVASTITKPPASFARVRLSLGKRSEKSSIAWSFASPGGIVGVSYLQRLGQSNFTLGGELYYTEGEHSGGLSIGMRWKSFIPENAAVGGDTKTSKELESSKPDLVALLGEPLALDSEEQGKVIVEPLIASILVNPLMGHVQLDVTSPTVIPSVKSGISYEVNLHSFQSNLAMGLVYTKPRENGQLQLAVSGRSGIALSLQSLIAAKVRVRFGLSTGSIFPKAPPPDASIGGANDNALMRRGSKPSIGVEISYSS